MSLSEVFDQILLSDEVQSLKRLKENNPHHLEESVYHHTRLAIDYCLSNFSLDQRSLNIVKLALLLHDIGKPASMKWAWNSEHGSYLIFPDHGLIGARLAENLLMKYDVDSEIIYIICWLIENHRTIFEKIKKQRLRNEIIKTIKSKIGRHLFLAFMESNAKGRISSKHVYMQNIYVLIDDVQYFIEAIRSNEKIVYFMIAPSGCGKSTLAEYWCEQHGMKKTRFDQLKIDMYSDSGKYDYETCGIILESDLSNYNQKCINAFRKLLKADFSFIFDSQVLTSRRRYKIQMVRDFGYSPVAVLMPITRDNLIKRVNSRRSKLTYVADSIFGYDILELPNLGEFDEIIHINSKQGEVTKFNLMERKYE